MVREKGIDLRKPLIRTRGGGVRAGGGMNPSDAPEPATRYNITITSDNTSQGTVTGGGSYTEGDTVTLRATAQNGYEFTGWYNGNSKVSDNNPYTFTASQDLTLVARFAAVQADFYYGVFDTPTNHPVLDDINDDAGLTKGWLADNAKARITLQPRKTFVVLYRSGVVPTECKITNDLGEDSLSLDSQQSFYAITKTLNNVAYAAREFYGGNTSSTNNWPVEITFAANSNTQE